ncbi:T9SS type A sorting domain-containing protein [Neolewinella litorea]|uniref:T9SS type A sorting domain-containing protein n=1 Tax=Neolewinella litorea TaxID=2562452 RepID=A0A4V3XLD7_9BACT|nr:T9SS type A sorting domain-containing protein [Neolewinella litorea]THH40433.1 T9SS type A sorting domain-containing protein [Neolewinella litorea]
MNFYFTFLFFVLSSTAFAQGVCTINQTNSSQSLQTVCTQGANPALVDGVFTGTLVIDNVTYGISAADLSAITFAGEVIFRTEFKSHLSFAQDPTVAEGTTVTAEYGKHVHSSITAYLTTYEPNQAGRDYVDFANRMMSNATARVAPGGGEAMLPITLLDWDARTLGDEVELQWTTGREIDNDFFTVEHSTDGVLFAPLTDVSGAGTSDNQRTYTYRHTAPASGTNFYRLVQHDMDGSATVYPVVTADYYQQSARAAVYPNPASAGQAVRFPAPSVPTTANLYHLDGRLVASAPVSIDMNASQLALPGNLQPGVYILKVGNHSERLVVR